MTIHVRLPQSWADLSATDLQYVYTLLANGHSLERVKSLVLFRLGKWTLGDGRKLTLDDLCAIEPGVLADALRHLDWMDAPSNPPVRLEQVEGHRCESDALLQGVNFGTYLMLENLWQAYLRDPKNIEPVTLMNDYLYGAPLESPLAVWNTVSWFSGLKCRFEQEWPELFRSSGGGGSAPDMTEVMNAELRALTGGDVTKEAAVRAVGCWRALEELNAKMKESSKTK